MLRRVEDNGREQNNDNSDSVDQWSIRQTAVYHRLSPKDSVADTLTKSTFLLATPSKNSENQYNQYMEECASSGRNYSPWNIHRILVADSLRGWTDYLAFLEKRLKRQVR